MTSPILTILTNYKRPANILQVVESLTSQTVPTDIVIVDNAPFGQGLDLYTGNPYDCDIWRRLGVRDVFRVRDNLGPPCRFLPALAYHDYDYVYFHDEDMLPGRRSLEHLLATAIGLNGEFATIGQFGRRFRGGAEDEKRPGREYTYVLRHVARDTTKPTPVDNTCNAHLVRAEFVRHAVNFKWDLIRQFGRTAVDDHVFIHDDMLLCLGIQRATGFASWLTPTTGPQDNSGENASDTSLRKARLRDNDAVCARPTHRQERSELARMASKIGWKSLWRTADAGREQAAHKLL